jgi:hypothetical protein
MKNNLLLINGSISDTDLNELEQIAKKYNIELQKLNKKNSIQLINDAVELIFENFDVITFSRDFVISAVINLVLRKIKKILAYLRKKNKVITTIVLKQIIEVDDKKIELNISFNPSRKKELLDKIDLIDINFNSENITSINLILINKEIEIYLI